MLNLRTTEWHRNCTACVQPPHGTGEQNMHTLNRLIAFLLTAALPQTAIAYPTRPMHPNIPFAPDGASD